MDNNVLKTAFAALVHDSGKFADKIFLNTTESDHAVLSGLFLKHIKEFIPKELISDEQSEDSVINLVSSHHTPKTPLQKIIHIADALSNGITPDKLSAQKNDIEQYAKLFSIFEQLTDNNEDKAQELKWRYPVKSLSPDNIFPESKHDSSQHADKTQKEYKLLFTDFLEHVKKISDSKNPELWFEKFENLMMIYFSCVPNINNMHDIFDIPFYEHSKITSAFAAALYMYHYETGQFNEEKSKLSNYDAEKFILINGDFQKIQNFIFTGYGTERGYRSKILRGRSFYVSLLSELAADLICRNTGLPFTCVIMNAAGRFTILAPNTPKILVSVSKTEKDINDWLIKLSYGEILFTVSKVEASCNDFTAGRFAELLDSVGQEIEKRKFTGIKWDEHGGVVEDYLDSFNNKHNPPMCPMCGKRPSEIKKSEEDEEKYICGLCCDHIFIGTNIIKQTEIKDEQNKLKEPVFGKYQLCFLSGNMEILLDKIVIKKWNLSINPDMNTLQNSVIKSIGGYVPVHEKDKEPFNKDDPKTFEHIAESALIEKEDDVFSGIKALGVLKADVDNMGLLMFAGMDDSKLIPARLYALSRQLNSFFNIYIPNLLKTENEFNDIYTVFAGGDDLFLTGPWNKIIDFAHILNQEFKRYTCFNKDIHISAGISFHKPHTPIDIMAQKSENELEKSKHDSDEKNRITIFSETVTWDEFEELSGIKNEIDKMFYDEEKINRAMLHRLNILMEMRDTEARLANGDAININDMECTKWRYMLAYTTGRNALTSEKYKNVDKDEKSEELEKLRVQMTKWLEKFNGKLKIPVWDILYNSRSASGGK
jgi:CRISPR-associated protein Csm1